MLTPEKYAACGTEHAHQAALFMSLVAHYADHPELRLAFAIPNGGKRDAITAGRLKAEGVKAGVPDLMLPIARGEYHGLFIEMKRPKSDGKEAGTEQTVQSEFMKSLTAQHYLCATCHHYQHALEIILWYCKY